MADPVIKFVIEDTTPGTQAPSGSPAAPPGGGVGQAGQGGGSVGGLGGLFGRRGGVGQFASLLGDIDSGLLKSIAASALAGFVGSAVGNLVRQAGSAATQVVGQNDISGVLKSAVDKTSNALLGLAPLLGPLGPVAMGLGAVGKVAMGASDAVGHLTNTFLSKAQELATYSPAISLARAEADIRGIFGDFAEARRLGPKLAGLVESESLAEEAMREALLPVKDALLDVTREFSDIKLDFAEFLKENKELIAGIANGVRAFGGLLTGPLRILQVLSGRTGDVEFLLDKHARPDSKQDEVLFNTFLTNLMLAPLEQPPPGNPPPPVPPEAVPPP